MNEVDKLNERRLRKYESTNSWHDDVNTSTLAIVECTSCKSLGRSIRGSPLCPNKNISEEEQVISLMGGFTSLTQKRKSELILRP